MAINMKKNIRTLGMVVGLGLMSTSMTSCFNDSDTAALSNYFANDLNNYIESQNDKTSRIQSIEDISSDLSIGLTDYIDSQYSVDSINSSDKEAITKQHVISGSSIKYVKGVAPKKVGVAPKKITSNKKASLGEYKLSCDLLGVDYKTKIFSPDALNFPKSSTYVTTYPAYENVLLPSIIARTKKGMSSKDAVYEVFSKADNDSNNAITLAEAKVFSHTDKYIKNK